MKVIHWNISYSSKKEIVAEYLKDALKDNDTVACLQEVTENAFSYIMGASGRIKIPIFLYRHKITTFVVQTLEQKTTLQI